MSPCHSRHAPPPPKLYDELILEVFLRIRPDRPECLVRASCVSKQWRRVLSSAAFRLRYIDFHRTPPMLGFFYKESLELESEEIEEVCTVRFVPTTAFSLRYIDFDRTPQGFFYEESPELELEELEEVCPVRFVPTTAFRLPSNPRLGWSLIDAHHGRVLFYDLRYRAMVVWDPITTDCRHVPVPLLYSQNHYAVLCATAGCNHRSCSGGPFIVVLVGKDKGVSYAHVYSSESEGCYVWGRAVASIEHPDSAADFSLGRSVLVENILYIPLGTKIMGYDTANQQLGVINTPSGYKGLGALMTAEDGMQGKLGLAVVQESQVHLWFRPVGLNEAIAWKKDRVIDLETLLPIRGLTTNPNVVGSADGVAVIFISTDVGLFTIELKSDRVQKLSSTAVKHPVMPYTSFCTLGTEVGANVELSDCYKLYLQMMRHEDCHRHEGVGTSLNMNLALLAGFKVGAFSILFSVGLFN